MASQPEESSDRIERLLRLGEQQGFLTYQTLNDRLPDVVTVPVKLDALLSAIHRRGIRLIDEAGT